MSSRQEQKMVTIALDETGQPALEGIFVAGPRASASGALIAPPHPLYGGSMDSPVVSELAHACKKAGLASLCFNWRGAGASAGEPSGEAAEADADCAAALRHLAETVPGPITACGYSFGAGAVVRVGSRDPRVGRLLLVAPPLALLDPQALAAFAGRVLAIAAERDAYAPPREVENLVGSALGAEVVVVPGADHFFAIGLAQMGRAAADWLARTS